MNSEAIMTTPSFYFLSSSCFKIPSKQNYPYFNKHTQMKPFNENERKLSLVSLKCFHNPGPDRNTSSSKSSYQNPESSISCSATTETPLETTELVADKLQRLVTEFKSLTEPIDRVKRLLHYAAILPPFDESARVPANRVTGCTTQVWLDAKMDAYGKMIFRADSDSEITKGYSSCLIWMLDGAEPEEVLRVNTEDLGEMNVGLHGKAQSRVNTWHNVLISMQKRTKALVAERGGHPPLEPFPSLVATADDISAKKSYPKRRYSSQDGRSWMPIYRRPMCGYYVREWSCNP